MRLRLIIFVLVIKSNILYSQNILEDSINFYIKKLDWNSFTFTPTYARSLVLSSEAQKLVYLEKKDAVNKLFPQIIDSQKTVIIHIILSKIFEPQNAYLSTSYIYKEKIISNLAYCYNNLNWQIDEHGIYIINADEIKKIKTYWEERISFLTDRKL